MSKRFSPSQILKDLRAGPGEYKRVPNSRPMSVGAFMGTWERNFKAATTSPVS